MEILVLFYYNFIKYINKNILLVALFLHSDLDVNCVSLINQYSMGLSNPKTQTMFGILELYDHIMLFLLLILVIKMIFFVNALGTSTQYMPAWQRLSEMHELWVFDFFCRRIGDNYERVFRKNKKYFLSYASILVDPAYRINIKDVRSEHQETFYNQLWSFRLLFLKEWYWNYVNKRVYLWNHSPVIEYVWTVFPAVVLGLMGVPSFLLLYSLEESAEPIFNISVIGNQWYWTYEYLDFDIHKFFSILVFDRCADELEPVKKPLFNNIVLLHQFFDGEEDDLHFEDTLGIIASELNYEEYFSAFFSEIQNSELIEHPCVSFASTLFDAGGELSLENAENFATAENDWLLDLILESSLIYFTAAKVPCASTFLYVEFEEDLSSEFYASDELLDSKCCDSLKDVLVDLLEYEQIFKQATEDKNELSPLRLPFVSYELGDSFSAVLESLETTISIDSQILPDSDLPLGYPRLLSTDQVLVIPTDTTVRFLVTSNDVIHSWALPSFGIKIDAVPGRINQVITKTPFFGSTWGQCSELCGVNHGFMPIEVRALSLDDFNFYIKLLIRSLIEPGLDKLFSNSYVKIVF